MAEHYTNCGICQTDEFKQLKNTIEAQQQEIEKLKKESDNLRQIVLDQANKMAKLANLAECLQLEKISYRNIEKLLEELGDK